MPIELELNSSFEVQACSCAQLASKELDVPIIDGVRDRNSYLKRCVVLNVDILAEIRSVVHSPYLLILRILIFWLDQTLPNILKCWLNFPDRRQVLYRSQGLHINQLIQ